MAHDGRHPPFPFPIPDPPRFHPSSTFPPPRLAPPDEALNVLERRIAGVPLPLFFAIGAVVGIVLAMSVVSLLGRSTPKRATQAKVVSVVSAPTIEHARALFVWPPATAEERAPSAVAPAVAAAPEVAAPVAMPAPAAQLGRPVVAMNRPRATPRSKVVSSQGQTAALPRDLLSAGL